MLTMVLENSADVAAILEVYPFDSAFYAASMVACIGNFFGCNVKPGSINPPCKSMKKLNPYSCIARKSGLIVSIETYSGVSNNS